MGFLNQLLKYKNICIQCHNSPDADALAAAYGVYTYLKLHDINLSIIYSGDYEIQKKHLLYKKIFFSYKRYEFSGRLYNRSRRHNLIIA